MFTRIQKPYRVSHQRLWLISLVLIILLPIGLYYRLSFRYAINVPFEDDYDSGIAFISSYHFQPLSVWHKLKLIFSFHNEHRIAFNRLVFLIDYALEKQVNFRTITLVGNLSLVFILWLFYHFLSTHYNRVTSLLISLPIPFLLFQLHFWELLLWGMASIQNLYVLVFVSVSLYTLAGCRRKPLGFGISILSAVIATFTSGNGLFVFLVGVPVLVVLKQYRFLMSWLSVGVMMAALYFSGYTTPHHHPAPLPSAPTIAAYFFTLIGSLFSTSRPIAILAGMGVVTVLVGLLSWLIYTRQVIHHLFLGSLTSFLLITCGALSIARSGFGIEQALAPRYGIIPVMLLICLYLLVTLPFLAKINLFGLAGSGLLLALCLNLYTYRQNLPKLQERYGYFQESCFLYHQDRQKVLLFRAHPDARAIFYDGINKGIYRVPYGTR